MNVDGTWTGTGEGSDGESFPVVIVFTAGAPEIRGYTLNERGEQVALRDVQVAGREISFWFQNGDVTVRAAGTVTATEMRLRGVASAGITIDVALMLT